MGKKHGGRVGGLKPHLSSSSASFARRGNPMVTEREAMRDYGRNPSTEDAEYDADRQRYRRKIDKTFEAAMSDSNSADQSQFTKAGFANHGDKGSLFRKRGWHEKPDVVVEVKRTKADILRKKANIGQSMHMALRKAENAQVCREKKTLGLSGVKPDNIPAVVAAGSKAPSREKQTPKDLARHEGFYDFSGKKGSPNKKEIKKAGKIFRRKTYKTEL